MKLRVVRESLGGAPKPDQGIRDSLLETMTLSLHHEECLGNRQKRGGHSRQRKQNVLGHGSKGGHGICRKTEAAPILPVTHRKYTEERASAGDS